MKEEKRAKHPAATTLQQFIRSRTRSSKKETTKRQTRQKQRSSDETEKPPPSQGNILTKWLKDLRLGYRSSRTNPAKTEYLSRENPRYHSEGKRHGKKHKERRRHSFTAHRTTPTPHRRTRTNGFEVVAKPHFPAKNAATTTHTMMPSRSTPNLQQQQQQQQNRDSKTSIYSYLQNQSGLNFAPVTTTPATTSTTPPSARDDESPPPAPPVRDSSSLRSIRYGPGHEKFPSWPVPAAADTPQALRTPPSGGSHRSKSWTDHTNYPKEKVVTYTRPYMKRQHSSHTQQKLKTVMEKCEKIPPETYESRFEKMTNDRLYLPRVDRDGKPLGDVEYNVPSPPERDLNTKPQLTQAELEEYARSYQETNVDKYHYDQDIKGLENFIEYARNYEETLFPHMNQKHDEVVLTHLHQKQLSYAQSEGYHSYVSSTDSTSTPFLDRLRRDSEAVPSRQTSSWDDVSEQETTNTRREGRDSVVTTSSGSASSSETLKWHGSMSDLSVASSCANSSTSTQRQQHIAHSARVQTPQRHHSESVLYMSGDNPEVWKDKESRNNNTNKLKLFAVNTYTVQNDQPQSPQQVQSSQSPQQQSNRLPAQSLSVADRISELEKQQKYSYLDPEKKHKVPDPTLKAIQKKALLSFYERHHNNPSKSNSWRSEPQLAQSQPALVPIPQPPPRIKTQTPSRRASCASDYASNNNSRRSSLSSTRECKDGKITPRHQHSNSCGSLSTDLLGPVIVGPSISLDDWVPEKPPERPPKNPHLRIAYPDLFQDQRVPTPDLPPPSPPTVLEDEVINSDEPLPPPPSELETSDWQHEFDERLKETTTGNQFAAPQVESNHKVEETYLPKEEASRKPILGIPERGNSRYSSMRHVHTNDNKLVPVTHETKTISNEARYVHNDRLGGETSERYKSKGLGFPNQRNYAERSSARYPSMHKLALNGNVSQKVMNGVCDQYRAEPLRSFLVGKEEENSPILRNQRASIADCTPRDAPPPLQPRQMRINQSMRARISESRPGGTSMRTSPPRDDKLRDSRPLGYTMSQSKASYLASRRDRDRIVPDSDTGSYKRTVSPNGHVIQTELVQESPKINTRETIWPLKPSKESIFKNNNNNNNGILRRASMCDNQKNADDKDEIKKAQVVLPDVLPVNAKMLAPRSQFVNRPTHLSLSTHDSSPPKTPPKSPTSSPPKSPSRSSPYTPLRSTNLSSSPLRTLRMSPANTPAYPQPVRTYPPQKVGSTTVSPPLPQKTSSPELRPALSLQRTSMTEIRSTPSPQQRISIHEIRTSAIYSTPPHRTPPLTSASPPGSTTPPLPTSPPPLISSTPQPEIKPSLSPNLSNTIVKLPSPISTASNTPVRTTPESTPPSSPKVPSISSISPPSSPKESERPKVIEGLQMIQRTEVILRVNATTTDASSQTEKEELPPTPLPTRRKLQEEIECEKLSQDFVNQLPVTDRLKGLLGPDHKKLTDYVSGLFRIDVTLRPRPAHSPFRSRNNTPSSSPPPAVANSTTYITMKTSEIISPSVVEPTSPLSATSTYFTTSEPKAKFLTRYSQDMNQYTIKNTKDLNQKKEELVTRLDRKLEVLRSEQLVVSEECRVNNDLGENVEAHIAHVARPHEAAKFRLHVEEVGKITSLLLGLSGRLARVENALMGMPDDHPEKRILESKRDKLLEQLEEAKKLKESIDRRSVSVSNILYKYLNTEEYADYDHFINMKAKLIMDSKEIADKIKLGEEQLMALKETLIVTD